VLSFYTSYASHHHHREDGDGGIGQHDDYDDNDADMSPFGKPIIWEELAIVPNADGLVVYNTTSPFSISKGDNKIDADKKAITERQRTTTNEGRYR